MACSCSGPMLSIMLRICCIMPGLSRSMPSICRACAGSTPGMPPPGKPEADGKPEAPPGKPAGKEGSGRAAEESCGGTISMSSASCAASDTAPSCSAASAPSVPANAQRFFSPFPSISVWLLCSPLAEVKAGSSSPPAVASWGSLASSSAKPSRAFSSFSWMTSLSWSVELPLTQNARSSTAQQLDSTSLEATCPSRHIKTWLTSMCTSCQVNLADTHREAPPGQRALQVSDSMAVLPQRQVGLPAPVQRLAVASVLAQHLAALAHHGRMVPQAEVAGCQIECALRAQVPRSVARITCMRDAMGSAHSRIEGLAAPGLENACFGT